MRTELCTSTDKRLALSLCRLSLFRYFKFDPQQKPCDVDLQIEARGFFRRLRFHLFTIGHAWTTDYGCADKADQFEWLIK